MSHINTPVLFAIPISIMMMVSIPIAVVSGYLNGKGLMVKLGILTVISAGFQFAGGAIAAYTTHSGFLSLLTMSLAQTGAIFTIYLLFKKNKLPKILSVFKQSETHNERKYMRSLLLYTFCASVAIMLMNLVQIADLLIIQSLNDTDVKFYTDIYVISRIVFFGGMIFIWPFLSEINIKDHQPNRKPFTKVALIFTAITICSIIGLLFFGSFITNLLFGTNYDIQSIQLIGVLSVLYKFFFLIITAATLYFVVLRNYAAIFISLITAGAIFSYAALIDKVTNTFGALISLNLIAGIAAAICVLLVLFRQIKPKN
ncbi:MAG: hypothetical protein WCP11_00365 [Candidatus Saccharibacteria bacterium]